MKGTTIALAAGTSVAGAALSLRAIMRDRTTAVLPGLMPDLPLRVPGFPVLERGRGRRSRQFQASPPPPSARFHVPSVPVMTHWTPAAVTRVLDTREPTGVRELADYLLAAATLGRAVALRKRPWLSASTAKEDDVHEVILALFANDGRLLRKFGDFPDFRPTEHALRRYVIGITYFVLLRRCQKDGPAHELLREDLSSANDDPSYFDGFAGLERDIDMNRLVTLLSPEDRDLFDRIYVQRLGLAEICAQLGITTDAFHQRKSRLVVRLRTLLLTDRQ